MAALVIPNAGMLTLQWSGSQGAWNNVLGLIGVPALPIFDQTLANGIFADVKTAATNSALMSNMATTVVLEGVKIRSLSVANQPEFVGAGTPLAGGGTGDMLPLSVAACITIRTAFAGKRFRGRVYLSGWDELMNDASGRQAAAVNTTGVAFLQGLAGALLARSMDLAVLGRPRDAVTIPAKNIVALSGIVNRQTVFVARNSKWESQRRRTGRQ